MERVAGITLLADHLTVPESVRHRPGEIWWVDGGSVKVIAAGGAPRVHAKIDCPVLLGLSFTPQGSLLVSDALRRRIYIVSETGQADVYADLAGQTPYLINEPMMLADASVIVGDFGFDVLGGGTPQSAQPIRISSEGAISRTGSPMWFANGLVSIEAGNGLLAAETAAGQIRRYRLRADGLDDGEVIARVDVRGLDGIALSPDGSLWCADIESGCLVHLNPQGREIARLATGFPHATCCTVEGVDGQLLVTVLRKRPTSDLQCDGALLRMSIR